jgi:hypothetical protein
MIGIEAALAATPHFERFLSVAELDAITARLAEDPGFSVEEIGTSPAGRTIRKIRFGAGPAKALFVGFPHCKEPIGSLTVAALLHLLETRDPALMGAPVEWTIIPCIDPDGAVLNEGWSLEPLDLERYMRNFYVQPLTSQVDGSFPVRHKRLAWDTPSAEAEILRRQLDAIRPDFYFPLHNAWVGGAFFYLSRPMGKTAYDAIYALLARERFPLQVRPMWQGVCEEYAPAILQAWTIRLNYDYLEARMPNPETALSFGSQSWDYLATIKPDAVSFAAELGYMLHPDDGSDADTGENLRAFKLLIDTQSKLLAWVLLEEWEKVAGEVDAANPIHAAVTGGGVIPDRAGIERGGRPMAMQPTADFLSNPLYDRPMKEGDRFQTCMVESGFWFLCHSYQLVRLLKASRQTPAMTTAVERLEAAFDAALAEIKRFVDFDAFAPVAFDTLARVQLGSGLAVLNAVIGERTGTGEP